MCIEIIPDNDYLTINLGFNLMQEFHQFFRGNGLTRMDPEDEIGIDHAHLFANDQSADNTQLLPRTTRMGDERDSSLLGPCATYERDQ
jgi:hypothetical protein